MGEIIFVILLAGGMLGSGIYVWVVSGYWHFFATIGTFFICFGLLEWHAVKTTGFSISQQIGIFGDMVPSVGFFLGFIGANIIAWLSLMWHFIVMRGRKKK